MTKVAMLTTLHAPPAATPMMTPRGSPSWPEFGSDSDGGGGGGGGGDTEDADAAKRMKKAEKEAEKTERDAARAEAIAEVKAKKEEEEADAPEIDPVLQALLIMIRVFLIAFGLLAGIVGTFTFCILLITITQSGASGGAASGVSITPLGNKPNSPISSTHSSCSAAPFIVQSSGQSCREVGGKNILENCVPDEPMQWQLDQESWACVDYAFTNEDAAGEELSLYCLATTASLSTIDDTQFHDCELPCPTPGQQMTTDKTKTDPIPDAAEGFGDYGFAFNRYVHKCLPNVAGDFGDCCSVCVRPHLLAGFLTSWLTLIVFCLVETRACSAWHAPLVTPTALSLPRSITTSRPCNRPSANRFAWIRASSRTPRRATVRVVYARLEPWGNARLL